MEGRGGRKWDGWSEYYILIFAICILQTMIVLRATVMFVLVDVHYNLVFTGVKHV